MNYNRFSYIYPPRPKNAAPIADISKYDNGTMIAQPKYNGSNCTIYTNGIEWRIHNRHNDRLTNFNLTPEEMSSNLFKCERGQWMVINGEYLNKAKNDEKGALFNHKLIIFDILVYDSDYLLGKTFKQRIDIMDAVYGTEDSDREYLYKISENIYRTKTYDAGFVDLYANLAKIDLIEGLVIKRHDAKLELGLTEDNNSKSQVKFRKKTLNYSF
jgi:ATP-dependent DNA ligase